MTADYELSTRWRLRADLHTVTDLARDLVADPTLFTRLWPDALVRADVLRLGDATGRGLVVDLCTRGFLPYRLRWRAEIVEARFPSRYVFRADGDFEGRGIWSITAADDDETVVGFDWDVRVNKSLVRALTGVLRPLFVANHRWAMARGVGRLRHALRTRRPNLGAPRRVGPELAL